MWISEKYDLVADCFLNVFINKNQVYLISITIDQ